MVVGGGRVVVIGGGIAGVTVASALSSAGHLDVILLEASDRLGGRIRSGNLRTPSWNASASIFPDELGATWIHGRKGNPLYELATRTHLIQRTDPPQKWTLPEIVSSSNQSISSAIVGDVFIAFYEWMDIASTESSLTSNAKQFSSVGEFLDAQFELECAELHLNETEKKLRESIFERCKRLECSICGCDSLEQLKLSEFFEYDQLDDQHTRLPMPFKAIVDFIAEPIPHENIFLNTLVSKIEMISDETSSSVVVSARSETDEESEFHADYVVSTVSLGVLKERAASLFHPPLPQYKMNAIKAQGFGVVDKILVYFNDTLPESLPKSCIYLSSAAESRHKWLLDYAPFVSKRDNHTVEMWISGEAARESELQSIPQLTETVQLYLNLAWKSYLASDSQCPKLSAIERSMWQSNPLTRGSYSFNAVGSCGEDFEKLAEPILCPISQRPCILFAGEATHRAFYSTTTGAHLSGEREAKRILRDLGKREP